MSGAIRIQPLLCSGREPRWNRIPDLPGTCSNSGSKAYNEKLSEQRMNAVRSWFIDRGIAADRMTNAYFHGIDYNAPSADEARRAELKFVK